MVARREYHGLMRWMSRSIAFLALFVAAGIIVPAAHAQINGVPSSVTSPGFGGHPVNGAPPSVTSLGPRGFTPNPHTSFTTPLRSSRDGDTRQHRHHRQGEFSTPLLYAYPVPYAVDNVQGDDDPDAEESDSNYQGGPTVFDRRGSGARSYVPPVADAPAHRYDDSSAHTQPDPAQTVDPTLLVFKDGRKLEVGNYAIVGVTLFDLTPGHPRKIAISDLDLEATRKQNDDRGVVFQLPPSLRMN